MTEKTRNLDVASRRRFLGSVGTIGGVALAGCTGGGNSGSTGNANGNGGSNNASRSSGSNDFSDVEFEFWDIASAQAQSAENRIESMVSEFEQETGATVKVNYSSYKQLSGPKWVQSFDRGQYPVLFTAEPQYLGRFYDGGYIEEYKNYKDLLSPKVKKGIKWTLDPIRNANRGFGKKVFDIPFGFLARNPFVARIDHFEKAGLDPKKNFPPKNFEHLVDVAKTLQKDGPADNGFQIFGANFDWQDVIGPWTTAEAGVNGMYINEDWTSTNYNNNVWKKWMRRNVNLYQKYGVSGNRSPTISDEAVRDQLINGKTSMSTIEWFNHPTFLSKAPKLITNGSIQYAENWKLDSGQQGELGFFTIGLTVPPDNVKDSKWRRKQEAASVLMEKFFEKSFQSSILELLGELPIRQDLWGNISVKGEKQHHALETAFNMAENMKYPYANHPDGPSIFFESTGPIASNMIRGNISVEAGMEKMNKVCQKFFNKNK